MPRVNMRILVTALVCALLAACGQASAPAQTANERPPLPDPARFDADSVKDIEVEAYPVVPEVNPAMREGLRAIYQAGLAKGNNPRGFSKLGDCMTENEFFLAPFSDGQYDLGQYGELRPVLDQFLGVPSRGNDWKKDSFGTIGLAAASGFNVAGPLDPTWANPEWCQGAESPLQCEYRVARPSIALIMFGTNDVQATEPGTYDYYLRSIISATLDANVAPILSTFPTRPENPDKSTLLNQIVIRAAQDYQLPLINLNRALEQLPNQGVNPDDTLRLSVPPDEGVDAFTPENLKYGFTVRNLVTLQALDAVLKAVK